jgi:DNA-binding XRE family transcriptional regulator
VKSGRDWKIMARNWKDVRADAAPLLDEQRIANERKALRAEVRAYRLAEVRRGQGVTQSELAQRMGVKQPRVSAIERGRLSATELGTLESYVNALGGKLRVVADLGDESIVVRD